MNDFDSWNLVKKNVDKRTPARFPKEGEVWISILGKNIGVEQNGSGTGFTRPVLVFKKFNNKMYLIIPLSSHQNL